MKKPSLKLADYLNGCASFLASLKPYISLTRTSQGVRCRLTLPDGNCVNVHGQDEPHVVLNLMHALVNLMPQTPSEDQREKLSVSTKQPVVNSQVMEMIMHSEVKAKEMDEATRRAREQIGVTTKVSLLEKIDSVAKSRGVSRAVAARDLLQDGLTRFDRESRTKSTSKLLAEYERKASDFVGADTQNWSIRAERRLVMKAQLTAGEYERSTSSFVNGVLAEALSHCPVAAALAEKAPAITDASVALALEAIERVKGPKAKQIAAEADLGDNRVLATLILSGSVFAPARVVRKMADYLQVPFDAFSVALERRFTSQPVPAFKATSGKPEVDLQRKSWTVAVKELELSPDEEARLLQLEG
ncbi:hypothetical protein [Pseudomonas fluorescens]|uniref:Uncharacterized protein n=1 Tax=Pseudomonas fluorescens TaxID=294 RepID=A0A125QGX4_PSEFL|nr:hypothetical protein [Pseudomonas fluorescens]KWV82724.1 hypothetical protein PFL603g_00877 [Pseudomonas fluorescens]